MPAIRQPGAENDPAVSQTVMNVLKEVAQQLNCFVLGVDHYGKDVAAGTRGSSAKEASADLVLACLGDREQSGRVTNTRLAVRKCRSGPQGQEFYFTVRKVEDPRRMRTVIRSPRWSSTGCLGRARGRASAPPDPWAELPPERSRLLTRRRVLYGDPGGRGVEPPITPDGPVVRMVDRETVREEFYTQWPAEGTPERKRNFRRMHSAELLIAAESQGLIRAREIGERHLPLAHPLQAPK